MSTGNRMPSRRAIVAGGAGGLLLALGAIGGLALHGSISAQDDAVSHCTATVDKVAAPTVLELGQTTRLTLTLASTCLAEAAPIDVMMVLDVSASMGDNGKIENAKAAGIAFVNAMEDGSRVGLVKFNQDAGVAVALTDDRARVRTELDVNRTSGLTNVSQAIDVAAAHLAAEGRANVTRAMIVLTDGKNTVPADPIPVAAQRAKDAGLTVVT
ncbi:MAG: vWA domain-containing protein, partial [Anaerolineae bacterium]